MILKELLLLKGICVLKTRALVGSLSICKRGDESDAASVSKTDPSHKMLTTSKCLECSLWK